MFARLWGIEPARARRPCGASRAEERRDEAISSVSSVTTVATFFSRAGRASSWQCRHDSQFVPTIPEKPNSPRKATSEPELRPELVSVADSSLGTSWLAGRFRLSSSDAWAASEYPRIVQKRQGFRTMRVAILAILSGRIRTRSGQPDVMSRKDGRHQPYTL